MLLCLSFPPVLRLDMESTLVLASSGVLLHAGPEGDMPPSWFPIGSGLGRERPRGRPEPRLILSREMGHPGRGSAPGAAGSSAPRPGHPHGCLPHAQLHASWAPLQAVVPWDFFTLHACFF